MTEEQFNDTRPYYDSEVPAAIRRIAENIYFPEIAKSIFPEKDINSFAREFKQIKTVDEFQSKIMYKAIGRIVETTVKELTYSGIENISNEHPAMQISNHRDIVLDSAILGLLIYRNKLNTSEITFGSNLMNPQIVVDIGKINKMFKIIRGGTAREIFLNSLTVSEYMRHTITQKLQSTWIAQRNGRTKNGADKTEVAVLKMFALSSKKPFSENLAELNITPISVSYEYEPCDFLKTREAYISSRQPYTKQPGEDLLSIIHGIKQYKGNVHFTICKPVTIEELQACEQLPRAQCFIKLAEIIDQRIFSGYKLWKTNFIAHDLLNNSDTFSSKYSALDKAEFILYMEKGLDKIEGETNELRNIFLTLYTNPINNSLFNNINLDN
ncbi:MAG: acyltransferase [Paludibacter sp.]|jgi:hypothetical protein|nr:acyltransferase [Paludibacter sp.]